MSQRTLNLSRVALTLSVGSLPGVPYYANLTVPLNVKGKLVNLTVGSALSIPVSVLLADLSNAPEIKQHVPLGKTITYNVSGDSVFTYRVTIRTVVIEGVEYPRVDEPVFPGCVPVPLKHIMMVLNRLVSDGYVTAGNSTLRALMNAYAKYVKAVSSMEPLSTVKRELRYVVSDNLSSAPQAGRVTYTYAPLMTWREGKPVEHAVLTNPPTLLPKILEGLVVSKSQSSPTNLTILMSVVMVILILTAVVVSLPLRGHH